MTKTIENYEINPKIQNQKSDSDLAGVDYKGFHYIIDDDEQLEGEPINNGSRTILLPDQIYKLISYNPKSKKAVVEEIKDKGLIEKVIRSSESERFE